MGNEYQRENESVISFANRMRDLCRKILDAGDAADVDFKTRIEQTTVECFKQGLKPEIEQKLENADDIQNIVKNAVKAERLIKAQQALRNKNKSEFKGFVKSTERKIHVCQICKSERHETNECKDNYKNITCKFCNKTGHKIDRCFLKLKQQNNVNLVCQLCDKMGHAASSCMRNGDFNNLKCQLCNNFGHNAKQCRGQSSNQVFCQICKKSGHIASKCYSVNNTAKFNITCQLCNKPGHLANNCLSKNQNNDRKFCNYCKNTGHNIEECRKRMYNENIKAGNGQGVPRQGAKSVTPERPARATNLTQIDEEITELIPLN